MAKNRFFRGVTAAGTLLLAGRGLAAEDNRPNIVFIFSDDHAWQAVSAYGESRHLIQTPNIDRLAKEGMRFDRCLVPNPLCGPSRATVLTGKYSHMNGFYSNQNCVFDGSQETFPKLLQATGYQTAMVGKWHLESDPTGFDYWEILRKQGQYYNPPMFRNGESVTHEGYVTDIITDLSLDWLKHRDRSKPFLLMCHNKAPHRIWEPALRDLNFDHDRTYELPKTLFDDYSGRGAAEHEQNMTIDRTMRLQQDCKLAAPGDLDPDQRKVWDAYYDLRNAEFEKANLTGKALVEWKYNRYMHDYLGCVKGVDDNVGRILQYLDDTGLASNTIVIYSSDQGFFLGEHGWFDKRWIFEESARAPLLVRWPDRVRPGSVCDKMVSNLDFAETFLDAAGIQPSDDMQGQSLIPLLKGETPANWRTAFYFHYYEFPFDHNVHPQYGVITDRYKLVHIYTPDDLKPDVNYWELFDLQKDPDEMLSVYDNPEYAGVRAGLMKELTDLRSQLKEPDHDMSGAYGAGEEPKRIGITP